MKPDDYIVTAGGLTAPFYLPLLNEWIAFVVGCLTIAYLLVKLWKLRK